MSRRILQFKSYGGAPAQNRGLRGNANGHAMRYLPTVLVASIALTLTQSVHATDVGADVSVVRTEALPIKTITLSDGQFLRGDASGRPTTIAGTLRIANGEGRLPLVVFLHGSGGLGANLDVWARQFQAIGISTFALDSFSGRGIVSTVDDQSKLGRLNMILDLYRALAVLASQPRVDPSRIAVMGFSRGGHAALYASLKRFQKLWNVGGIEPAAYIALYPSCITTYLDDTDVSDRPIRIFSGISDDYVEIGPCRDYVGRLRGTAKDVKLVEYPDTWHAFDNPLLPATPIVVANAQTTHCILKEGPVGVIINTETRRLHTKTDSCIGRNPHEAYSRAATEATEAAVKDLLHAVFKLN
jgi:dienelactone hydrolase